MTSVEKEKLWIQALGTFLVSIGGKRVVEWKSRKAEEIFKLLLLKRGRPVHKDIIVETIWPDVEVDEGDFRFYKAISRLYRSLEPSGIAKKSSYVQCRDGAYWIDFSTVGFFDVHCFQETLNRASLIHEKEGLEKAVPIYLEAENLYKGDLFEGNIYQQWMESERERLKKDYIKILSKLSIFYHEKGDYWKSIEYCLKRINIERFSCEAHILLMKNYALSGEIFEVIRIYREYEQMLKEEMGIGPSFSVIKAYEEIIKKFHEGKRS